MVTGLAHVCFVVRDLPASEAFYVERLGLAHGFDFINDDGEKFGVYLHAGQRTFVELFVGEPTDIEGRPSYQHFCLEVDDLSPTVEQLRAKGVEVTDPKLGSDSSWQSWLKDPDGNRIELHCYTPESKQGLPPIA